MARSDVSLEDCFLAADSTAGRQSSIVWRVVDLFQGTDGIAYARLVSTADRSNAKTIAAKALKDRSLYLDGKRPPTTAR